jgi:hypothetical protein
MWGIDTQAVEALFLPEGYRCMPTIRAAIVKFGKALKTNHAYHHRRRTTIDIRQKNPAYGKSELPA